MVKSWRVESSEKKWRFGGWRKLCAGSASGYLAVWKKGLGMNHHRGLGRRLLLSGNCQHRRAIEGMGGGINGEIQSTVLRTAQSTSTGKGEATGLLAACGGRGILPLGGTSNCGRFYGNGGNNTGSSTG